MNWLTAEWKKTSKRAQIFLRCWSYFWIGLGGVFIAQNLFSRQYINAFEIPISIAILMIWFVLCPFVLASFARKRGGAFGQWLGWTIVFSFVITGFFYIIWSSAHPATTEVQDQDIEPHADTH